MTVASFRCQQTACNSMKYLSFADSQCEVNVMTNVSVKVKVRVVVKWNVIVVNCGLHCGTKYNTRFGFPQQFSGKWRNH
jgi:hypothetical protein